MAEDWDLFAIVRSCQSATNTATATIKNPPPPTTNTTLPSLATFTFKEEYNEAFSFPNIVQPITNEFHGLNQLLTPFNPTTNTTSSANGINTNSPVFAGCIGQHQTNHHLSVLAPPSQTSIWPSNSSFNRRQHVQKNQNQLPIVQKQDFQVPQSNSALIPPNSQPQTPKARKKKNQQKKMVCHVTADNLSSDLWAWRKYGQKPIKGSPYPRNYYRCSSSKGCAARKQVERSNTEDDIFIVTYTGDHSHPRPTHRNSLAGSTRNKSMPSVQTKTTSTTTSCSSPPSSSAPVYPPAEDPPAMDDPDPDPEIETDDDVEDEADILLPIDVAMPGDIFMDFDHFPRGGGRTGEAEPSSKTNPVESGFF